MRRPAPPLVLILCLATALLGGARAPLAAPGSDLREEFRRHLLRDRTPCPLAPQSLAATDVREMRVERIRFTPEKGHDAVAVIYRPGAAGRYPAVIFQHHLGANKDHILFAPLFAALVQRGYLVAAIDARYRGERTNGRTFEAAALEALRTGRERPFLLDTAYDVLRLVDYLETRPDVDPRRIGMTGISEGGILTWMCAAADDRIRVAVPIIGVTSFREALEAPDTPDNQAKLKLFEPVLKEFARELGETRVTGRVLKAAWEKLVPGMLDRFDAPALVPLIAPRPLLILNHEQDELFPVEGAKKVFSVVKARYQQLKAQDCCDFRIAPGLKHAGFSLAEITGMLDWMDRWLKPTTEAELDSGK